MFSSSIKSSPKKRLLIKSPQKLENCSFVHKFPAKFFRLVNSCRSGAVCWSDNGSAIRIWRERFESEFLEGGSNVFKTSSFSSFVRQLNLYRFRKIVRPSIINEHGQKLNTSILEYKHPLFLKGHPELIQQIRRTSKPQTKRIRCGQGKVCQTFTTDSKKCLERETGTVLPLQDLSNLQKGITSSCNQLLLTNAESGPKKKKPKASSQASTRNSQQLVWVSLPQQKSIKAKPGEPKNRLLDEDTPRNNQEQPSLPSNAYSEPSAVKDQPHPDLLNSKPQPVSDQAASYTSLANHPLLQPVRKHTPPRVLQKDLVKGALNVKVQSNHLPSIHEVVIESSKQDDITDLSFVKLPSTLTDIDALNPDELLAEGTVLNPQLYFNTNNHDAPSMVAMLTSESNGTNELVGFDEVTLSVEPTAGPRRQLFQDVSETTMTIPVNIESLDDDQTALVTLHRSADGKLIGHLVLAGKERNTE